MASAVARPAISEPAIDLLADRAAIEQELRDVLPAGAMSPVSACMEYAVLGEAQRLRPLLAVRVGRLTAADPRLTMRAAAAVELVHCASLVVDDLPSMDNDVMRRNRPSAHIAYGESTALLAAFGLVALAARSVIEQSCNDCFTASQKQFQISLLRTLDCSSLIGGQVMDLALGGERREQCRDLLNELKTVPLFVLAVEAGQSYTLQAAHPHLRQFGRLFGIALQMTDDLVDGESVDSTAVMAQLRLARECLMPFGAAARPLADLVEHLHARAQDHRHR
jgi:farnesyl diphosphate synthase